MTFDEWRAEPYSRTFEDAWKAGAASRDAEVNGLNQRIDLLSEASLNITKERDHLRNELNLVRMQNAVVYGTSHPEIYKTKEDELREDVELLREAINDGCLCIAQYGEQPPDCLLEALAATKHHDRS